MDILRLYEQHVPQAVSLVRQVFDRYVGPDYTLQGCESFYSFLKQILSPENGRDETLWGCYIEGNLAGVLLARADNHISLLFVLPDYHRRGVARALFETLLLRAKNAQEPCITVHASSYGIGAYKKLGFYETDVAQEQDGIRYTPMKYYLKGFLLRPFVIEDALSLTMYANDFDIAKNLRNAFPHPYTFANAVSFIKECQQEERAIIRCIEIQGEAAGSIGIFPGNDVYEKSAEIGYWLAKPHWGKGIAPEAARMLCAEAFTRLGIVRVHAEVFAQNNSSCRVLEKAGFIKEGVKRNSVYKNNQIMDSVVYALLKEDFAGIS